MSLESVKPTVGGVRIGIEGRVENDVMENQLATLQVAQRLETSEMEEQRVADCSIGERDCSLE